MSSKGNEAAATGPLPDEEFQVLARMLRRYCQYDLDQWENWRCRTTYGDVYISISRRLPDGHLATAYDELPSP